MRNILLFLITITKLVLSRIRYKTSLPIGQVNYKVQEEKLIEIKEVPMD